MVDDVKDITEKAESKEALDRARLARERREAEQRKRLDELRAHAAAAQAHREKRDEERRKRQAEQRARDDDRRTQKRDEELCQPHLGQHAKEDDRRLQVEERKRAIWEASISRREALLQRERDRTERLERARAARSSPRPAFAFGSSTPRLLEPVDSAGFFWAARSTNPIDQMNFFESLAASTTNVMFASAPLTRRASALQLDSSDTDNKDEPDRSPQPLWSSVARRRTDLVPTLPAPRAPGRAYSMTRLDRLAPRPLQEASPSLHHLHRTQTRSGETTPGSRPGSAMSNATGVVRRASSAPRKPRPASIAGTGVNTPRGPDTGANSVATTPSVSRDATTVVSRPATTPRRPRPLSLHASSKPATPVAPGEGKPPLHRKPKPSKDHDKSRGKSLSASPGRTLSPSPAATKDPSVDKEIPKSVPQPVLDKNQVNEVNAIEVTQKLEALRIEDPQQTSEIKETIEVKPETNNEQKVVDKPIDVQKPVEKETADTQKLVEKGTEDKREEKKEPSVEKTEDNEMTASMVRRITTEEEAKAALAERRRRAREELERQAELERQRLQREAEEEAERQRQEEERQRREEEEARELAALQRKMEEEKLRKAIEAQQQLEKEEAERRVKEEEERKLKAKEDEERRKAADEAERVRRVEAEKEERERLARKQRVEAIMARTRLKKQAEEDKKQQELKAQQQNQTAPENNTSADATATKDSVDSATPATNENGATNLQNSESATHESVALGIKTESVDSALVNTAEESAPLVNFAQDSAKSENVSFFSDDSAKDVVAGSLESASSVSDSASIVTVRESVNVNLPVSVEIGVDNINGNMQSTDLLQLAPSQPEDTSRQPAAAVTNNGNVTADLLGLSQPHETKDKPEEQTTKQMDNTPILDANNGNANVGHISANFIQTERLADVAKLDDFASHNGHNHPLTLQNAI
ncbi:apical junction molecule-like isoform X1 [Maniola jurtina]|uniref:apical junction molecule-like isoform X1 n=1 Tax=Maniola jurtina TaxID=191418 RepID=UPI001E68C29F|nr:apical junction molecule-like isoform X1 [Maniola jurtina]